MGRWLWALLALSLLARSASIRDVDFRNFSYPFPHRKFLPVPDKLRWLPVETATHVSLRNGEHAFPCGFPQCESLTFDQVRYGEVTGLGEAAVVTTVYHTGGTANWQYLYVVAMRSGRPRALAWLEAGSRAYMGLRSLSIDRGDLVLVVNDPDKREGDCCSTGSITLRYRWMNGHFQQAGKPIREDDPPH
jgi:hypothetical protein